MLRLTICHWNKSRERSDIKCSVDMVGVTVVVRFTVTVMVGGMVAVTVGGMVAVRVMVKS